MRLICTLSVGISFSISLCSLAISQEPDGQGDNAPIYLDEPDAAPPPVVSRREKVTRKYEDDSVRVECEVALMSDGSFMNDGKFTEFYRGGQKFSEGTYDKGVHTGEWKYWHPNGKVCKTLTYSKGKPDGKCMVYRDDGSLLGKKDFDNGIKSGKWTFYFTDGKTPKIEVDFQKGLPHGHRISYFPDGKIRQKVPFQEGKIHGKLIEWDDAGEVLGEAIFVEGKRQSEEEEEQE